MARHHVAYKYDDDLRHSILELFDEAQVFPGAGRRARSRGLLTVSEREGYSNRRSPCSQYQCVLCNATSPVHNCPHERGGICQLCGSAAAVHDCKTRQVAESFRQEELAEALRLERHRTLDKDRPNRVQLEEVPLKPAFCADCGSTERDHVCRARARLAHLNLHDRRRAERRKQRLLQKQMEQELEEIPTAAE